MENYSTLTRDKSFQKSAFKYISVIAIIVVAIYGVIYAAENYFGGNLPSGNKGSSYATISTGTNAWEQLLKNSRYDVVQDRGSLTLPQLNNIDKYSTDSENLTLSRKTSTIILLGGSLPNSELSQVDAFVKSGGRLISDNPDVLHSIFGDKVEISVNGSTDQVINSDGIGGTDGIAQLEGSGVGSIAFSKSLNARALIIPNPIDAIGKSSFNSNFSNASIIQDGSGDVIAMMDLGNVSNQGLVRKDNALFSIRIAGNENGHVTFLEGIHGYASATGFSALPLSWRFALIGIIAAFIIFGSTKARRFGVGEDAPKSLGPKRIVFAQAITHAMKKSNK